MARFPSMKPRELQAVLMREPLAYRIDRQRGSHMRLVSDNGYPPITFAPHAGGNVAPGLVRTILCKQIGLSEAEALDLL
jgi:predicted RNA binding protein YcfA (HicA-like mRNA interferase family)